MVDKQKVAIIKTAEKYPVAPFNPPKKYPELNVKELDPNNEIYDAIRQLLYFLDLDKKNYGTKNWNPLKEIIKPNDTILIKPNLVISQHPLGKEGVIAGITHASIIRPLIDYILLANKKCSIIIADSPLSETNFNEALEISGLKSLKDYYANKIKIEFINFMDSFVIRDKNDVMRKKLSLAGDPKGYTLIDLKNDSEFNEISESFRLYRSTASYYENLIIKYHNKENNIYSIPNSLLNANLIINVPKLKVHRKTGVTLSLKNIVGITNEKRFLPHHRIGSLEKGGDMYSSKSSIDIKLGDLLTDFMASSKKGKTLAIILKKIRPILRLGKKILKKTSYYKEDFRSGSWYGNDTAWRMILDLNKILFYCNKNGKMENKPQRKYLSIVDGIIAGEKDSPLIPTPKKCGVIIGGFNPIKVDLTCIRLIGFDWKKIPLMKNVIKLKKYKLDDNKKIEIVSNNKNFKKIFEEKNNLLNLKAAPGWEGYIELK